MSIVAESLTNGFGPLPRLGDILKSEIIHNVEEDNMIVWDKGIFLNELLKQGIALETNGNGTVDGNFVAKRALKQGTYKGTQLALTEIYSLIEEAAASHFDTQGFEPIIPQKRGLGQKQNVYKWSNPATDGYPPHLKTLPADLPADQSVASIFDASTLTLIKKVAGAVLFIIPDTIPPKDTPFEGPTIADCENWNRTHPSQKSDIMDGENIGNKADWYSDARFAQQHLSGVNPSTIQKATPGKVKLTSRKLASKARTS
jgi:hypothetical protein